MTLPNGWTARIVDGPSVFNCDISTNPTSVRHIATFVGDQGQSTICWECAEAIADLVIASRTDDRARVRRIPNEPKLRVEAVV